MHWRWWCTLCRADRVSSGFDSRHYSTTTAAATTTTTSLLPLSLLQWHSGHYPVVSGRDDGRCQTDLCTGKPLPTTAGTPRDALAPDMRALAVWTGVWRSATPYRSTRPGHPSAANRYRLQRTLAVGADIYSSDTDEQRDMLSSGVEERGVDIGIDDLSDPPPPTGQRFNDRYYSFKWWLVGLNASELGSKTPQNRRRGFWDPELKKFSPKRTSSPLVCSHCWRRSV